MLGTNLGMVDINPTIAKRELHVRGAFPTGSQTPIPAPRLAQREKERKTVGSKGNQKENQIPNMRGHQRKGHIHIARGETLGEIFEAQTDVRNQAQHGTALRTWSP